ncbi:ABC transporter permease [Nocardioides sp. cx-173]|uniref:ABC transporter permease n=1 Tax=Nocardioides sp. cx-173 TaxID=2898796 RepID=UPI001E4A9422|nr:ABC transporter permease [Nocardioides sp. cx-173]MCD4523375.1 ABC transporter permease [Nocardioides sp. cx-173]UGB42286.1 ABC transporter permease [Nocardioides sp. cx-173]
MTDSDTERPSGSTGPTAHDKHGKHAGDTGASHAGDPVDALPVTETTASHQTMDPGAGKDARGPGGRSVTMARLADTGFFRVVGLVVVLLLIVIVGTITAGDRFLDADNFLTILRLSTAVGVVSVGMTFVITGGGIDLSVGAVLALSSVWATTVATQELAADTFWGVMVLTALGVGAGAGLVNGVLIAYGRVVAFITTLAMLVAARGLAEKISGQRTQIVSDVPGFYDFFRAKPLGVDMSIWLFVLVAVLGWILLNRTTFGRRTFAVGGNPEAARLAGINVRRHTVWLYVLVGACSGIAALMIVARTTTGSSTHGELLELDAIAAVVIGGTLLAGGRGTITGTVLGVLIFTMLTNVFTLNNREPSEQDLLKGAIIVAAVLLQQWLAARKSTSST